MFLTIKRIGNNRNPTLLFLILRVKPGNKDRFYFLSVLFIKYFFDEVRPIYL